MRWRAAFFTLILHPSMPVQAQDVFPSQPAAITVIEGGTLIDGTGNPPQRETRIVIVGDRIGRIGHPQELPIPRGARIVSAKGKYIIPGLIDSHVHYRHPWMHKLFLANGVTTVRDLGGSLDRVLTLRQEIRVGDIVGPRLFVSGMAINPRSMAASGYASPGAMAQGLIQAGVDGIKVTGYTTDGLKEIVRVAHSHGLTVYGHTGPKIDGRAPGALLAVEAGLDGVEHINALLEDSTDGLIELPEDFDSTRREHLFRFWYGRLHRRFDPEKAAVLIRLMVRENVYWAPTLVNSSRHQRKPGELAADPALNYIPEGELDTLSRFGGAEQREWEQTLKLAKQLVLQFHENGGFLIAGTDSPGAALPGWSLHREMELLVEAGLPPMAALQAATLNNARALQKEELLGTVEAGKYADLVILEADPLAEIRNTSRIDLVMKGGTVLDPQQLLEENLDQFGARGERRFPLSER